MKAVLIPLILLCAVAIGILLSREGRQEKPIEKRFDSTVVKSAGSFQKTVFYQFWDERMSGVFGKEELSFNHPIAEIQNRYSLLRQKIEERYRHPLRIDRKTTYSMKSKAISAGCWVDDSTPHISFFVPALIDSYNYLVLTRGQSAGEKLFETHIVVAFLHELDHLAFGYVTIGHKKHDLDFLIEIERLAWAQTCEYTMGPLVEKYKIALGESDGLYYEDWIKAGRDANNPLWIKSIREVYSEARK